MAIITGMSYLWGSINIKYKCEVSWIFKIERDHHGELATHYSQGREEVVEDDLVICLVHEYEVHSSRPCTCCC